MKLRTTAFMTGAILILMAASAMAQSPPVANNSNATYVSQWPQVSMFLVPNGSGTALSSCWAFPGIPASARIDVTLRGVLGLPSPGVNNQDIRLNHNSPLAWCPVALYPPPLHAPNLADGPTNAVGQTRFSMSYHGGGGPLFGSQVWVLEATGAWNPIPVNLPIRFNSADLNGDLVVNLSDVAIFASIYFAAVYDYRIDYNWDGANNLPDVGLLAGALGATCP